MSRVGQFGQISEINDHLYLSGAGVIKPESLRQKGITCIINATVEEPNVYLNGVDYLKIRVEDHPSANLSTYFDLAADKIRAVKDRGGKTLVHCVAGVSRSASLCIIYLVKYHRLTLRQAYHKVKTCRPIIHPNPGFWKQMIEYELRFSGKNTVHLVPSRHEGNGAVPDLYAEGRKPYPSVAFGPGPSQSSSKRNGFIGGSRDHQGSSSMFGSLSLSNRRSSSGGAPPQQSVGSLRRPSLNYRRSPSPGTFSTWSPKLSQGSYNGSYSYSTNTLGRRSAGNVYSSPSPSHHHSNHRSKAKGNIFSSLYQTHQDILFPSF